MERKVTSILLISLLLLVPTLGYFGYYVAIGSDQYEVIRFAGALKSGSIFLDHPVFELVKDRAEPGKLYSIHYGGYLLRDGRIFCKYAIGYPLILAAFLALFGLSGVFFANFFIYSALLLIIYLLGNLYFSGRPDRRALSLGAALLFFLLIEEVWQLSVTPHGDVASLFCLTAGIYFLVLSFRGRKVPAIGRVMVSGLFLGFSAAIRTPNILMVLPAGLYFLVRLVKGERSLRTGIALFAAVISIGIGLSPALYQNHSISGSIFKPPQIHEIHVETVTESAPESGENTLIRLARRIGDILTKRTSGWGIGNIHAAIWPMMFHLLVTFGPLFVLLFLSGLVGEWKKDETRLLFFPAIVTFLVFYSGWVRPLERYLIPLYPLMTIIIMGAIGSLLSCGDEPGPSRRRSLVSLRILAAVGLVAGDFLFRCLNPRYPHRFDWDVQLQYVAVLLTALALLFLWYRQTVRRPVRHRLIIFNLALFASVILASSPVLFYKGKLFQLSEARRLRNDLGAVLKPPSIIFATKFLSQSLDLFTGSHSLRPSDLEQFIPDYGEAYDLLMREGFNLYIIDNRGKRSAAAYIPYIQDYFTVSPLLRLPGDRYHLEGKFGRAVCTVYSIRRWDENEITLDLATPAPVDYLLTVNFYRVRDSLPRRTRIEAFLPGEEWNEKIDNFVNYFPLSAAAHSCPRSAVRFTSDQGLPEDIFVDLQWLGRDYVIRLGPAASVPDRIFLSDAFYYSHVYKVNWRSLTHRGDIKIPTPAFSQCLFTAEFRLQCPSGKAGADSWEVLLNDNPVGFLPILSNQEWQTARVELPVSDGDRNIACLTIRPTRPKAGELLISSLRIAGWFDQIDLPTPREQPYLLKMGVKLFGAGDERYLELNRRRLRSLLNDGIVWHILSPEEIARPISELKLLPASGGLFHVSILEPLVYPFRIDIGAPESEDYMGEGFFPPERHLDEIPVCWTGPRAEIFLPLVREADDELILTAGYVGVRPEAALPATVRMYLDGALLHEFPLEAGENRVRIALPPEVPVTGVASLVFEVDPWRPCDYLPTDDRRELGLMLDYVEIAIQPRS
ncbi:MAG: hypothetical protein V1789_05895 [PVC group bacterium]